jgi:ribonuclease Z
MYFEAIIDLIQNTDLLYHEATFLEKEAILAKKTMHSTATQAAKIALKAEVKQLILGHYSTRYDNLQLFKNQAKTIFENVILANDGLVIQI